MDTKKLRQKILDLAIRGKLVPQDSNDEPASVLLERIRAEKEQLIKEGKIKRSKKSVASDTSHYENVPFEVPESWCWTSIETICSKIGSGSTPRGSNYSQTGIPFFRSQNVYNDGLCFHDIKYISKDIHQSMIGTEVLPNDVLLNITGGSLGRCAVVPTTFNVGNVSQHVCILRPVLILPKYLHAFILSGYFHKNMEVTGSGREGLPKYSIEKMLFPIPPINEQKRIIDRIGELMLVIDYFESACEQLEQTISQYKEKTLELALSGKLVPQNPTDEPAIELLRKINPAFKSTDNRHYGQLPDSWETCQLKDIFDITMGQSPAGDTINGKCGTEFHQGKINFTEKYLSESSQYTTIPSKIAAPESLLLCVRAPVGVVNITKREICIGRGLCSLRPKYDIDCLYWLYMLSTLKDYFEDNATGSTFKAISGDLIKNASIPFPPLSEQKRILSKINAMFSLLDKITAEL